MSTPTLLHDSLRHGARLYPGREAIRLDGSGFTYAETWERSCRLASALRHGLGLEAGARFGVLTRNTPLFAELVMGASLSGTVCVPLNFRLAAPEVAGILADAGTRLLLASPALEDLVAGTMEEGWDGLVVWLDAGYEDLLLAAPADAGEAGGLEASSVVLQMYTSGTTGAPKGVMLSHRNLVANSWTGLAERNVVEGDVYLVSTPLCQIGGLSRLLTSIHTSAEVRLLDRFDAERALALIGGGEVTTAFLVPTMIQDLLEAAGAGPVSGRFRRLCYGGSPIDQDLLRQAMEVLACEFQQGYGLTESSPNLTCLRPEDHV
ncbi:MAG: AMP-binding protein, partial [bacterium]|nr:AMP-binding protein [bacterium]